ncbi:hypothetical protein [Mucilaginibacter gotjawali]|uniref:Uncharacterized protein n=2 Tax=Mucilaginibacter gotjawali TaxID=1550579 RepID=A0A110B3N8_9SPHI|nr:hypothetical protein [Mucilaginibacter gotjawali]MBB3058207.1 hypothetical protein [Mucilaginibacter gotjawali]BAU54837.1 hypothetical protein MgSA37_03016 [Mucilaginibacter gotjawali]
MKTRFIFRIATVLLVLFSFQHSYAQIIKIDTLREVTIRSTTPVAPKVQDAFSRTFKDAVGPRWYKLDKNYLVNFITKDQKNKALYDKKGSLVYHISYLNDPEKLPKNIKYLVSKKFHDYKLLNAIHIAQNARSIWVVNLKDGKELVLARVEEEQVEEIERVTESAE